MFSFAGDTVLDPFLGTGSTAIAAIEAGRNSLGVEIDRGYVNYAAEKIESAVRKERTSGAIEAQFIKGKMRRGKRRETA